MQAYLDNSATTRCSRRACDVMVKVLTEDFGNPSSLHTMGISAEGYVKRAKEQIAKTLKAEAKEILFTSGGTESNNLALFGTALANRRAGSHIITTSIEHPSVSEAAAQLGEMGFRVTFLPVDGDGIISLEELKEAVCEETILVSLMMVNNEMGALEPIEEAAKIVKAKNPKTILHVDGIQAYGKYRICPKKMGIDLLSVSGHKIHGPKGIGFLYIKDKTKIKPILYGGGQQKGMRSGTENVPGAAALGAAAEECYENFEEKIEHLFSLKERFIRGIQEIEGISVHGKTGRDSAPHIVSVGIDGVRSEVMLHSLEEKGIYVSAGSACSSNKPAPSRTLQGIGLTKSQIESAVRFSFCADTTEEEIDYAVAALKEIVPFRRKFIRK